MADTDISLAPRPAHVPDALVRDVDYFDVPGGDVDIQAAYAAIQRSHPDIFWTPRNGGHWMVTRGEDIIHIQRTTATFSNANVLIPPPPAGTPRQIPLELDPPIHAQYRRPLMQALTPGVVQHLEDDVRQVAVAQIEALMPRGECEFIADFAKILPIHIFLELVRLPMGDKEYLVTLAEDVVRCVDPVERNAGFQEMGAYLYKWVQERRADPGDDLLSRLVNTEVNGAKISDEDAVNYATLVLFGGLDTVAGMIGLIGKFLAEHPDRRREMVARLDDDAFLKNAIEELLRRHGIANTARIMTEDTDYKGVTFHKGDIVMPPNLLVGVDDRLNNDPLTVDFHRAKPAHAVFGNGPHACPGATLARREIRVFLQEWLKRIPDFRVKPGTTPKLALGQVHGILDLHLVWP